MKRIELVRGIHSSVLGFGCAPVMGAVGSAKAKRAIDAALFHGINHFDLARSYGYGEAEQFLGKLLKDRRQEVVIATKFGIKANNKARLLKPFKPLVRQLSTLRKKNGSAGLAAPVQEEKSAQIADRFHYHIRINAAEMTKSLDESLKALKTDYVDYFFIHEPPEAVKDFDEVLLLAEKLKQQGKIRAFGLAYVQTQQQMHAAYLDHFDLLQMNNSPGAPGYEQLLAARKDAANIFFSPLRGGAKNMTAAEKLKRLNTDFSRSVILCSMFNEHHIEQNAALFK